MSCLILDREGSKELNLYSNIGYNTRQFNDYVRVPIRNKTDSSFFIKWNSGSCKLPNRKNPYRNHFKLYSNKNSIIIVRCESTLIFKDTNAILNYEVIECLDDYKLYSSYDSNLWEVSYDRIKFSNQLPPRNELATYYLQYTGEWWFFDKGIILNGIGSVTNIGKPTNNAFIYYELLNVLNNTDTLDSMLNGSLNLQKETQLHQALIQQSLTNQPLQESANSPMLSFNYNDLSSPTSLGGLESTPIQTKLPITLQTSLPYNNNSNNNIKLNEVGMILPSISWFCDRKKELINCDISYFLPKNNLYYNSTN